MATLKLPKWSITLIHLYINVLYPSLPTITNSLLLSAAPSSWKPSSKLLQFYYANYQSSLELPLWLRSFQRFLLSPSLTHRAFSCSVSSAQLNLTTPGGCRRCLLKRLYLRFPIAATPQVNYKAQGALHWDEFHLANMHCTSMCVRFLEWLFKDYLSISEYLAIQLERENASEETTIT